MFTGIIEEVGTVHSMEQHEGGWRLTLASEIARQGSNVGDSIAVDGVCLTITDNRDGRLAFGLAPETVSRTSLGDLHADDPVNLERAMAADGRFGGHMVQGHVDGTGLVESVIPDGDSLRFSIAAPPELMRYIVPKGFIAVDGTSLTVIDAERDRFTFMLVAYTQEHIALPARPVGSRVNLEVDIMAKYIERLLGQRGA